MFKAFAASVLVVLGLSAMPAHAQNPKIFVSSTGSDASPGSREQPKRSLQSAHDVVPAGGSIVILDTAGYAGVTITKSVSIYVPPGAYGFASIYGGREDGVVINAAPTDSVVIRGLFIEGSSPALGRGIVANSVGSLIVEDTIIRNFATGISVEPSTAVNLTINNTTIREVTFGLRNFAKGGAINGTATGLRIDGAGTEAISVLTTGPVSSLAAAQCVLTNNAIGVHVGAGATKFLSDACTITGSNYAYYKDALLSGGLYSRLNNSVFNNAADINLLGMILSLVGL